MASPVRVRENLTLAEFLRLPEEEPSLEYINGRIEAKVSPQLRHALIAAVLVERINVFVARSQLGAAVAELRCTFAGRSIVPDVSYLTEGHLPVDARGHVENEVHRPPDLHIEIISPRQTMKKSREKLAHSTANGCSLGWLVHPDNDWVEVFRAGCAPERLTPDGVLDGDPILPGFRLPVAALFACLDRPRGPHPDAPASAGNDPS